MLLKCKLTDKNNILHSLAAMLSKPDDYRTNLQGIWIDAVNGKAKLYASNGYIFSQIELETLCSEYQCEGNFSFCIPDTFINVLHKKKLRNKDSLILCIELSDKGNSLELHERLFTDFNLVKDSKQEITSNGSVMPDFKLILSEAKKTKPNADYISVNADYLKLMQNFSLAAYKVANVKLECKANEAMLVFTNSKTVNANLGMIAPIRITNEGIKE